MYPPVQREPADGAETILNSVFFHGDRERLLKTERKQMPLPSSARARRMSWGTTSWSDSPQPLRN